MKAHSSQLEPSGNTHVPASLPFASARISSRPPFEMQFLEAGFAMLGFGPGPPIGMGPPGGGGGGGGGGAPPHATAVTSRDASTARGAFFIAEDAKSDGTPLTSAARLAFRHGFPVLSSVGGFVSTHHDATRLSSSRSLVRVASKEPFVRLPETDARLSLIHI